MSTMNRIQHQILIDVYRRDELMIEEVVIRPESYLLKESDTTLRLREFCFHVEQLEALGFISIEGKLYEGSDKMSFTYLNNAIQLYDDSFKITTLGKDYAKSHLEPVWKQLASNKYLVVLSYILVLILGFSIGKWIF